MTKKEKGRRDAIEQYKKELLPLAEDVEDEQRKALLLNLIDKVAYQTAMLDEIQEDTIVHGVTVKYNNVWQQEKEGEAALAKASQDRQIKVQEAEAEREAALSQAEANKTLGESIRSYPEAMEQKWVEAIKETDNQVIYLPTECSIPVTEAGRVASKARQQ